MVIVLFPPSKRKLEEFDSKNGASNENWWLIDEQTDLIWIDWDIVLKPHFFHTFNWLNEVRCVN